MADRNTVILGNQIKDATITENELASSVAGNGLSGGAGTALALDLNELTGEFVDVTADSLAFIDATDSGSKKLTIDAFLNAIKGTGLSVTNSQLVVDAIADNIVEADFSLENFSATLNGVLTDFELTDVPVTASLQVFINGVLSEEGAGKDYELNPDSGMTKTIRVNGDVLVASEKLIAYYIINN